MKTKTLLAHGAVFSLLLSACGEDPIVLAELLAASQTSPEGSPTDPVAEDDPEPQTPPSAPSRPMSELDAEAIDVLLEHCGECHQTEPGQGPGIDDITNIDQMIADDMIVPGDRQNSRIYVRMVERTMPPLGLGPSDEEIEVVGAFIDSL